MFKVVLSHALCEEGMALLRRQMDVDTVVANTVDESELLPLLKDADAFILRMGKMNKRMLQLCPRMKVIARPGVGVDTIDVDYAAEHGIPVVVTPGANSRSVAEHKCALRDIACGEKVIKYGCPIGYATQDIRQGEMVRENNMKGLRGRGDLEEK